MEFIINIAGLTIKVNSMYIAVYRKCKGFISDPAVKADISVGTTMAQLQADNNRLWAETGEGTVFWNLECLAVHRQITEAFLEHDTLLIHGAAIAYDGGAYLFCAPSGTGKTTHIRLWLENLPEAYVVNGDKPFLRLTENGVLVCGSPWCGKENLGTNTMVPLKAVIFMERSERNHIQGVPFGKSFLYTVQMLNLQMEL